MIARFEAELWRWRDGSWCFVSLPVELGQQIKAVPRPPAPGFGSLKVSVTIGQTVWATSIFPDSESGSYVLPVKKAVRDAESFDVGDTVRVELEVLD